MLQSRCWGAGSTRGKKNIGMQTHEKNRVSSGKLSFLQLWSDFTFPLVIKTIELMKLVLQTLHIHWTMALWSRLMTDSSQPPLEERTNPIDTHVSTGLKPSPQAKQKSTLISTQPCISFQVPWPVHSFLFLLLCQDTRLLCLPFSPRHRFPVFLY